MAEPANPELYKKAKALADNTYSKPSAYKSGFIVQKYKEMGGTYKGKKPVKTGLDRWYMENWKDVATHRMPDGTIMAGATHRGSYPVYRPTKRITKDTPLTVQEIDPKNLIAQSKLKQKIRGDKNLPPFIAKSGNY